MEQRTIGLAEITGSSRCTASDDGQRVYEAVVEAIERGQAIQLSFEGVEDLTSAFLNAAVGQLYGRYGEEMVRRLLLPPLSASRDDIALLRRVVRTAKAYFSNPPAYERAVRAVMGEEGV